MDESIHLIPFQQTLTETVVKWYIEIPQHSFVDFSALGTIFLTTFKLSIRYEKGMDILNPLHQNTSTT